MTGESTPPDFDVAVVGGGIHGAGVAQAAAAAGYSTLVVEARDWGSGTSSRSSKLIHGGLRYLQQGRLGLVKENLKERAILLEIAPHLVRLNDFHFPVYRGARYRPWQLRAALSLYALLGGLRRDNRFTSLPASAWKDLDGLRCQDLKAVYRYRDAQTDDKALTRAVAASAQQLGAVLWQPARLEKAERTQTGYRLSISREESRITRTCRCLVNAAGPWIESVSRSVEPTPPTLAVSLVKGSHLVLAPALSGACYYLESPRDGRTVFVLPWHGKTLLGTTEEVFTGDPDQVDISDEEENYLLEALTHYFPDYVEADGARVVEHMSGLRVLPAAGKPFEKSRELRLATQCREGVAYIGIYGGKLTSYRATAEKVVATIKKCLGGRPVRANTANLTLP